MKTVFIVYSLSVAAVAMLATIAILSPRKPIVRAVVVVLVLLALPAGYLAFTATLGLPRPIATKGFDEAVQELTVLGVSFNEGVAIYLWVREDDHLEPHYLALPWRLSLAQRLQTSIDEAIRKRGSVRIQHPYTDRSFEELDDLNLRLVIPPRAPTKLPQPPAQVFNPRAA
ncbi:MAG: hypothetical protein AAF458_05780 [Pseudomonadota bacterium]